MKLPTLIIALFMDNLFCLSQSLAFSSSLPTAHSSVRDYLNPDTGRFWTRDSIAGNNEDPLSLHKYLYGADNPVNRIDPSGHDDIGDLMVGMDISAGLDALPNLTTIQGALSSGGTPGPDITVALLNTMNDVEQTFLHAPYATKVQAADNVLAHPYDTMIGGWDIEKLELLGREVLIPAYGFGNGSSLGTGLGADTVQFGNPPKVYYAGSVNYIIWGRMFSLFHDYFHNPLTGTGDPIWSESAAVAGARTWKALGHRDYFDKYATEAGAFVKFGYSATDPSSTALPLAPNPKNVGAANRLTWKWLGLRDNYQ